MGHLGHADEAAAEQGVDAAGTAGSPGRMVVEEVEGAVFIDHHLSGEY